MGRGFRDGFSFRFERRGWTLTGGSNNHASASGTGEGGGGGSLLTYMSGEVA